VIAVVISDGVVSLIPVRVKRFVGIENFFTCIKLVYMTTAAKNDYIRPAVNFNIKKF
jgi:hypothetical protein